MWRRNLKSRIESAYDCHCETRKRSKQSTVNELQHRFHGNANLCPCYESGVCLCQINFRRKVEIARMNGASDFNLSFRKRNSHIKLTRLRGRIKRPRKLKFSAALDLEERMKKLFTVFFVTASLGSLAFSQNENETKMKIILAEKIYSVLLDKNVTSDAILRKLPLELAMKNFGKHEFWAELPFKPEFAYECTSKILAGHVYYWDGWNAFVINYIDWDIAPYRVVHVGEIEDKSICEALKGRSDGFKVRVEK